MSAQREEDFGTPELILGVGGVKQKEKRKRKHCKDKYDDAVHFITLRNH